jgi:hypothetical protein
VSDIQFERSLLRADIKSWNADAAEAQLERIKAIVAEQAEDEGLWAIHPSGQQPIVEAYLQQELRRLHAVIEGGPSKEPTP